jgi:hypothetical protein
MSQHRPIPLKYLNAANMRYILFLCYIIIDATQHEAFSKMKRFPLGIRNGMHEKTEALASYHASTSCAPFEVVST